MSNDLHLALERRIIASCKVTTLEDLHVGAEREGIRLSQTDSPIQMGGNNKESSPLIPGSSIRGVLRSHIQRLLQSIDSSPDKNIKSLLSNQIPKASQDIIRKFQQAKESEKQSLFNKLGIVDRLFGCSGFSSPLRITDSICEKNTGIRERMHVSIDVGTGQKIDGALTDLSAVGSGSIFKFQIVFDELPDSRMAIANRIFYHFLNSLIRSSGIELFFGGWKSRGYGLCKVMLDSLEEFSVESLLMGEGPTIYRESQLVNFIRKQIDNSEEAE